MRKSTNNSNAKAVNPWDAWRDAGEPELITALDLAPVVGLNRFTVLHDIRVGKLKPSYKTGHGAYIIVRKDAERYIHAKAKRRGFKKPGPSRRGRRMARTDLWKSLPVHEDFTNADQTTP